MKDCIISKLPRFKIFKIIKKSLFILILPGDCVFILIVYSRPLAGSRDPTYERTYSTKFKTKTAFRKAIYPSIHPSNLLPPSCFERVLDDRAVKLGMNFQ